MNEKKPQPAWRKKDGDRRQKSPRRDHSDSKRGRSPEPRAPELRPIEVSVRGGDINGALRALKTRMSKEGVLAEVKRRRHAEKPSDRKRRKHRDAMKRMRKSKGRRKEWWKRGKRSGIAASVPLAEHNTQAPKAENENEE